MTYPPRPDQVERETPRSTAAGQRILRLGGTPQSQSEVQVSAASPITFFTFPRAGRIFSAGLSYSAATNGAYAGGIVSIYSRVSTGSGIVLATVRLSLSAPNQAVANGDRFTGPQAGVPVAKGDTLILDVNNGVPLLGSNGVQQAECVVFFSLP